MVEVFGPKGPTKGECVKELYSEFYKNPSFILCAGDDVTDETMFAQSAFVENMVSIKIGTGRTGAKYRVQNPAELRKLLKVLINTVANYNARAEQDTAAPALPASPV